MPRLSSCKSSRKVFITGRAPPGAFQLSGPRTVCRSSPLRRLTEYAESDQITICAVQNLNHYKTSPTESSRTEHPAAADGYEHGAMTMPRAHFVVRFGSDVPA